MTNNKEMKRVAYPEEIFPGVPNWRMDIAPVGPKAPELTPDATQFLVHLTQTTNEFFDCLARDMVPGEHNRFFTIQETGHEAQTLVNKTAMAVCDVTYDNPKVHLGFIPAGAIPIASLIKKNGYPVHSMHVLNISGSIGTETGFATIKHTIPPELLNPENDIVIPEDILDSVVTIFAFIRARSEFRDNSPEHIAWLDELGKNLQQAHKNGNNDLAAYANFAKAAAEEHVSILPVWSKNKQTRNALIARSLAPIPTIQQKLLECYPIMPLPENMWVLGGNYVMDTGVLWSRIRQHLPDDLQQDPRVTQYIDPNGEWLLRAVRIGPLAYFEHKAQEESVVRFLASVASEILTG